MNLKIAKARLAARVESRRVGQRFAISQSFQVNEAWQAIGRIESARIAISDARRATEFSYATDLSSLTQARGVAAPNTWADQVYDFDLSPLRAVGLSVGSPSPSLLDDQKLTNYVGNLKSFQDGYFTGADVSPVVQPAMSFLVMGPAATVTRRITLPGGTRLAATTPDPGAQQWDVECPATAACAPKGGWCPAPTVRTFAAACATAAGVPLAPLTARVSFHLDPWARVDGDTRTSVNARLRNGRWARFAVNLVGDGVRDCPPLGAPDPTLCRSHIDVINYDLIARGPFVSAGVTGDLLILPLDARVASNRAFDNGVVADPQRGGGLDGMLNQLVVKNLLGYPIEGDYSLVLHPSAGDDLGKIQQVQVVLDALFWAPNTPNAN